MADYSKLKARFPKARVGSIKRLAAALRRAESVPSMDEWRFARRGKRGRSSGETIMSNSKMKHSFNLTGRGADRVGYDPVAWINTIRNGKECGTWACIAGFAHIMRGPGWPSPRSSEEWRVALAEFIGMEGKEGRREAFEIQFGGMCSNYRDPEMLTIPAARHAASLMEHFLKTGEVDWDRALGMNPKTKKLTRRETALRNAERRRMTEMEREEMRDMDTEISA